MQAFLLGVIALGLVGCLTLLRSRLSEKYAGEKYFRKFAEALPEIVWAADCTGSVDYVNSRWHEYTGLSQQESLGEGWRKGVHPDDLPVTLEKWKHSVQSGNAYEVEYRFRRGSDGAYQWFLGRANPIRDEMGRITRWFGTCTNIEDQKKDQQLLEQQIRERTVELADTNTRLQEEMWERDVARKELDRQNEKMVYELKERTRRATLLAKMGELLQSCMSKDEVYSAGLGFAPKIFPHTRGAVALFNSGRNIVEVIGSWSDCRVPAPAFEPTGCWALRTGHPHLVVEGDTTARCAHAEGVDCTYLCIPILAQGEALGILHVQTTMELPSFGDAELSFKTSFAEQIGLSIANIRLREALRTQSIRDPLTGLHNRRYLDEILEREIRRAVRSEQSLGLLMLDLDHFKRFNDTYGHEAGDAVLKATGSFLAASVRAEDIVCRFGGEEFVVILPTADLEAGRSRAERICSKIRELSVMHQGHSVGAITVSIGVAALPTHGTSAKELLDAADAAMYRSKQGGRDRVSIAEVTSAEAATPQLT